MIVTTVNALLPIVVTLLLGYLASWHHDVDAKAATALNSIVITYALPLALFVGIALTPRDELVADAPLAFALTICLVLPYVAGYTLSRFVFGRGQAEAALQALGLGMPSIPFAGLPILNAVVGKTAAIIVAISGLVAVVLLAPATILLISLGQARTGDARPNALATVRAALVQPLVIAPLLGFALVLVGVTVPRTVLAGFSLFAQATGGLALFASGIVLQAQKPAFSPAVIATTLCRTIAIPVLAYWLMPYFGFTGPKRRDVVIALGLPAAALQIILAVRYKVAERENASFLLLSNIFSIPALALLIMLAE